MTPSPAKSRIELLDIWRGFAILGIFFANIHAMHSSQMNMDAYEAQFSGLWTTFAHRFDQVFVYGKFFTIFSFLFGLGVALQILKLANSSGSAFLCRRMLALFAFGMLHISFLWSGDVLHIYAILGLLALILYRLNNTWLLGLSLLLLLFPFYDVVAASAFELLSFQPDAYIASYSVAQIKQILVGSDILAMLYLRWDFYFSDLPMLLTVLFPKALAMFLLGLWIGKMGYMQTLRQWIEAISKPVLWVAIIANLYRLFFLFGLWDLAIWQEPQWRSFFIYLMGITETITGLFYLWLMGWLLNRNRLVWLFSPLRYVGKMALTQYLLQSFFRLCCLQALALGITSHYRRYNCLALFG